MALPMSKASASNKRWNSSALAMRIIGVANVEVSGLRGFSRRSARLPGWAKDAARARTGGTQRRGAVTTLKLHGAWRLRYHRTKPLACQEDSGAGGHVAEKAQGGLCWRARTDGGCQEAGVSPGTGAKREDGGSGTEARPDNRPPCAMNGRWRRKGRAP